MRKIGGPPGIGASFWLVLLAASSVAAWGQTNPVPLVNEPLVPGSAVPGGKSFTLTVNGTGFARGASVNWNGSPLLTVVNNQGKLTATVPAADIATLGTAYVTVTNPGAAEASNTVLFPIAQPSSTIAFAGSNVATLGAPWVLGVADFNGDGNPDIALQDNQGNIDVLLGHGDGTFSAPVVSAVNAGYATAGVIGDFNGDGKLDIVTAYVGVFFGNGDGTFTVGPQYPDYAGAAVSAGDLNGDGELDLMIVACGQDTCSGYVELGQGDGTFQHGGYFNGGGSGSTTGPAVGDFNRDGKLDVAADDYTTGLLGVFLGNGDGSFQNGVDYGTQYAYAVVTADFNGDGILDLAATDDNSNVYVFLGKGDGTFGTATAYTTGSGPTGLFVGDFNGDGLPDLMAATYNYTLSVPTVSLLLGNGDGTFQNHVDYTLPNGEFIQATGDFNHDGRLDFVATGYGQNQETVSVFLQSAASLSTTGLTFGDQSIATTSPPQTVTLTNVGNSPMTISVITFTGANSGDFAQTNNCGTSLAAGASCTINVTFTPTATGTRSASLSITDSAVGSPQTVSLTGTGTQATVVLSPTSLTFGLVLIKNTSQPQSVMLTDTGNGSLAITNISTTGDFGQTNTCGSSVAAGRACTITVTFKPTAAGTRTGTLSITDNAPGSPQTIAITGTGTVVRFSGISVNFGNQAVGTTSPAVAVTLANIGTTPLAISHINIQGADAGDFAETNTCGSGVAAGGSCLIKVTFTPTAKGSRTATLGVTDTGGGSPQRVSLSGDGT